MMATSQHFGFAVNKHKSEVQRRFHIATSVVIPEFTPRLRGDFLYSITYVFCSSILATLQQRYMVSHDYMPALIICCIHVGGQCRGTLR